MMGRRALGDAGKRGSAVRLQGIVEFVTQGACFWLANAESMLAFALLFAVAIDVGAAKTAHFRICCDLLAPRRHGNHPPPTSTTVYFSLANGRPSLAHSSAFTYLGSSAGCETIPPSPVQTASSLQTVLTRFLFFVHEQASFSGRWTSTSPFLLAAHPLSFTTYPALTAF